MGTAVPTIAERRYALERAMMRVRWFGVALGIFQTVWYAPNPGTMQPRSAAVMSLSALGVLLVANVVLLGALRGGLTGRRLGAAGAVMFALDIAAVWTIVWAFTFEPFSTTWVTLSVLCLEGALRYQVTGAMIPVALALPIELGREVYRATAVLEDVGAAYFVTGITFRVGILFMIGAVAGAIGRNLERARAAATAHAEAMEELARQEQAAQRESNAFRHVILAGVSAEGLADALRSMIDVIADELAYERLAVLMRTDDHLDVIALHGFGPSVRDEMVVLGQGIAGRVALTGRPEIIDDVTHDPDYYCVDDTTRSQVTLPIRVGDDVIGVLDVESARPAAFTEVDLDRLARLCDQVALVIQNARLLATERETVERLQDLDQMKTDFVAIASHELRTPLTSMQGSIKTLRRSDGELDVATTQELLAILERQTDRFTRLVEDLLLASRIDSGRIELRIGRAEIAEVLTEVLDEIGTDAGRVSLAIAPDIPPMLTDAQRFAQILRNLIENALKFSPPDSDVRVTAHAGANGLALEVGDDGPGIPPEEQERIFHRFHQVGGSLGRRSDGLGLGLFITKRLVEALGGSISVDSDLGVGASFRVTLPLAVAPERRSETA